jgi:hypothetical protein
MSRTEPGSIGTPDLLWFTNTTPFSEWIKSDGSSLYYPVTARTFQGLGQILIGMLASWWESSRLFQGVVGSSLVLYYGCVPPAKASPDSCTSESRPFPGGEHDVVAVLRSLISQYLLLVCKSSLDFKFLHLDTDSKVLSKVTKYFSKFQAADYQTLIKLLRLLVSNFKPASTLLNILCILHRVDALQDDTGRELLLLRTDLERLSMHVLITGTIGGANQKLNWGSDALAKIDEDTEYQGKKFTLPSRYLYVTNGGAECLQSLNFKEAFTRRDQVVQADAGTNQWIWTHPAYLEWRQAFSGVLWIQGKPGSGKSVLTKSIVSRFSASKSVLVASWFYSRRGGDIGTSEFSMIRSIVYQLLEKNQSLFRLYKHSYRQYGSDYSIAFRTFLDQWSTDTNAPALLLVIDAMDESSSHDTMRGLEILKIFSNFVEQPKSKLKVLISSRPYRTIEKAFGSWDILLENENSRDIEIMVDAGLAVLKKTIIGVENRDDELTDFAHVRRMLRRSKISQDLTVQHRLPTSATSSTDLRPRFMEQKEMDIMREYLLRNACGVMLWVALTLGEMVRQAKKEIYTWQSLMNLLTKLPVELRSVYQRIATELNASQTYEDQLTRNKILGWIMTANSKGPFRLRDLLDALSIPNGLDEEAFMESSEDPLVVNRPMVKSWNGFYQSLRELCGPLIVVISPGARPSERFDILEDVGPDFVVQLLHQTVKEFLDGSAAEAIAIKANVAALMVEESASTYFHLAIPTRPTKYTPIIREFGFSWERSIEEAVGYLEGKWLLKFVLDNYVTAQSEILSTARQSDGPTWILSTFFNNVIYRDVYTLETARRSVVGRCFWFACSHGLSVAVDNMLCAASLCPGWWYCHRQIVLSGVQLAAVDHHLKHLEKLLQYPRARFGRTPPLANAILKIKDANRQTRGLRERGRPSSYARGSLGLRAICDPDSEVYSHSEISKPGRYTESIPASSIGDSRAAETCIQRVLDYLDTRPSGEVLGPHSRYSDSPASCQRKPVAQVKASHAKGD